MIFLKPLDNELLEEVANHFNKIITLEDGTICGGLGTAVTEWMNDHHKNVEILRLGLPDAFVKQGTVSQLYERCGIDKDSIVKHILELGK